MPIETIPGVDHRYHLISFDEDGRERGGDPDGRMSQRIEEALRTEKPSDVFVFIHGWKGDLPAARGQYAAWMSTLMLQSGDLARARTERPGFAPLLIGLHWPSLPFGNESLAPAAAFAVGEDPLAKQIDDAAQSIVDTPAARSALRTIFEAANRFDYAPTALPADMVEAYRILDRESGMGAGGVEADPGADREVFDPIAAYMHASDGAASFGGGDAKRSLLSPLVQLSFWRMKKRAKTVGEAGGFQLLSSLMRADRNARFHLMGHSFGCIVASAAACGPTNEALPRPLHSVVLVQGALSLWSCSDQLPGSSKPGYFRRLAAGGVVAGPIVTTRSRHDTAVGRLYPVAAGVAFQVAFGISATSDDLPKYGGVGAFGLRGTGLDIEDLSVRAAQDGYEFRPGRVYNVNCDQVIREGGPPSGAHSDIARPEVGHLVWAAALGG